MGYDIANFHLDFMMRTAEIVRSYRDSRPATQLINACVGLLIVPDEVFFNKLPEKGAEAAIGKWGVPVTCIKGTNGSKARITVRQLVSELRNAVAHPHGLKPLLGDRAVKGFQFKDDRNFLAELSIQELKTFVLAVSDHLADRLILPAHTRRKGSNA